MRTKMLILSTACAVAGSVAVNAADPVYSVNVVGYVNMTFTANQFKLFTNPLDNTNTIAALFPNLTDNDVGSHIWQWTGSNYTHIVYAGSGYNGWVHYSDLSDANGFTLAPGQGAFFLSVNTFTNTFVGNVLQGSLSPQLMKGFTQIGSMVPQAGSVVDLGFAPQDGDSIYKLNPDGRTYANYVYSADATNWFNRANISQPEVPTLDVGDSVWYHSTTGTSWTREFSVK